MTPSGIEPAVPQPTAPPHALVGESNGPAGYVLSICSCTQTKTDLNKHVLPRYVCKKNSVCISETAMGTPVNAQEDKDSDYVSAVYK